MAGTEMTNDQFQRDILPALKCIAIFTVYYLINSFLHIILVSIFSFFHFQLNHSLPVVEDWMSSNTWLMLILGRSMIFFFIFKIFHTKLSPESSGKSFILDLLGNLRKEAIVLVFFTYIFFLGLNPPHIDSNTELNLLSFLKDYLGLIWLLLGDICMIVLLVVAYLPNHTYLRLGVLLILNLISFSSFNLVFPYLSELSLFLKLSIVSASFVLILSDMKLKSVIFYLSLGIIPLGIIAGFGILNQSDVFILKLEQIPSFHQILLFFSLTISYLLLRDNGQHFIFRKSNRREILR